MYKLNLSSTPLISTRLVSTKIMLLIGLLLLAVASNADDLKIGTTLTLSGGYANYGRNALHGMELAIDEVNDSGGINGRQVKLVVEDVGTYDLKQAATAARKLISADKVELLLPLIIEDAEVIVPITSKIPMFTMVVGCGARKCGSNLGKFNVRAAASHDKIIEKLAEYSKAQGIKHACVVAAEATFFEGYGRYIEELSKANGQRVTYQSVPLSASDDYKSVAVIFKREKCDAIFPWISMGSSGGFFRRVREAGSKALLFGIAETDDPALLEAAGGAAEGVVFARFGVGSKEFQERFASRFGEQPQRPALPTYDGVKLLLSLVKKVGTDAVALHDEILKVHNISAENGTIDYDQDGERTGESVQLMQIIGGAPKEIH